jgi:hypothetical protein
MIIRYQLALQVLVESFDTVITVGYGYRNRGIQLTRVVKLGVLKAVVVVRCRNVEPTVIHSYTL